MSGFKKATRKAVKLKLAVQGPSGSGKTLGALALAHGLAQGGTIAVVDTENGSASLYAERYAFDVLELQPPYTSKKYLDALHDAAAAGYAVVVLDSLSHEWAGDGGILSRKETDDQRPGSNSYTNWGKYTKEHEAFKAGILATPLHVVATMRSKQDYILETNDKGKQQPRKVGLAPVQRDGMEYEFTTVWELQMEHRAAVSKDRTGLFAGQLVDLLDPNVAKRLLGWLGSAAPAEPVVDADGVIEYGEPVPVEEQARVFVVVRKAGVTKEQFPEWYLGVTGRPWKAAVRVEDVGKLIEAADVLKNAPGRQSSPSQPEQRDADSRAGEAARSNG